MITIKTKEEIRIMREGGRILAEILKKLKQATKPGIATENLNKLAGELVLLHGVKSAFLGYGGYPASLCVSINEQVVHGVPSRRVIKEGDVVSLDMGIVYKGFYLDSAITFPALDLLDIKDWAKKNPELNKLIEITRNSLDVGIEQAKVGNQVGDIGHAIQEYVEAQGCSVIRDLVGHGIGQKLHEEPQVPNFGKANTGEVLQEGMVIAIEPMVTLGDWHLKIDDDKFTYKTRDGSFAAHFEHTLAITKSGPII